MKRLFAAVLLAALVATLSSAFAQDEGDDHHETTLAEQIDELRMAGRYDDALVKARDHLSLVKSLPASRSYQIDDARRLVETLESIVALPAQARREVASADRSIAVVDSLYYADDMERAIAVLKKQLAVRRRHLGAEHAEVATSLNNLGFMLDQNGEYEEAEIMFRDAVAVDRAVLGSEHPGLATDLDNLASFLYDGGAFDEARTLNREALEIFGGLGVDSSNHATALTTLATFYADEGNYAGAEPLARRSLAMTQRVAGGDSEETADRMSELGNILRMKGDVVAARQFLKEALRIYRGQEEAYEYSYAGALETLALVHHDDNNHGAARPLYEEALEIYRAVEDSEAVARLLNNLADLHHDRQDYELSLPMYLESLEMHKALLGDKHTDVATVLTMIARDLRDQGRYEEAETYYSDALEMYTSFLGEGHPYVAMCLYSYSSCLAASGDFAGARVLLEDAARSYELARRRAGTGLARATFQRSPYPKLAYVMLELGESDGAWPAMERQRGRVLTELLMATSERGLSAEEAEREAVLNDELGELERELAAYRRAAAESPSDEADALVGEALSALLDAQSAWASFQDQLSKEYPITEGAGFSVEHVQAAIPENAAIIGWLDVEVRKGQYSSWVYLVRHEGPVEWARIGETETRPAALGGSFRTEVSSAQSSQIGTKRDARRLWSQRFAPVLAELTEIDQLIVVPSGGMLGVPVDAVVDGDDRYLGDRYEMSFAPSSSLYAWLNDRASEAHIDQRNLLLVGDPPFNEAHVSQMDRELDDADLTTIAQTMPDQATLRDRQRSALTGNADALSQLPRLPGSRVEVAGIARMFPRSTSLVGEGATEERLVNLAAAGKLAEYDIIHFATHALVDDERPGRSALVLSQVGLPDALKASMSGERIHDGLVTASEIVREWRLDADLVTLSACETGLGRNVAGEGYIGLANAFIQAGARSVLVSLWKVDDRASSLLMRRFYQNLAGGRQGTPAMNKAGALREAKQWLRDYHVDGSTPFAAPYFWSGFILIGDRGSE